MRGRCRPWPCRIRALGCKPSSRRWTTRAPVRQGEALDSALSLARSWSGGVAQLARSLDHQDPGVRMSAAMALGDEPGDEAEFASRALRRRRCPVQERGGADAQTEGVGKEQAGEGQAVGSTLSQFSGGEEMGRIQRSRWAKTAHGARRHGVAAALMFGSFGEKGGPLGIGETASRRSPRAPWPARAAWPFRPCRSARFRKSRCCPSARPPRSAAFQAHQQKAHAAMAARVAALPASDPRVRRRARRRRRAQRPWRARCPIRHSSPGPAR